MEKGRRHFGIRVVRQAHANGTFVSDLAWRRLVRDGHIKVIQPDNNHPHQITEVREQSAERMVEAARKLRKHYHLRAVSKEEWDEG